MTKSEKLAKAKHIKKILKKRLSVDCLRMLGDEDSEDENSRERPAENSWNLNQPDLKGGGGNMREITFDILQTDEHKPKGTI